MKISVITVSFNSEVTIEETIKSVINQKYNIMEYIVIDGNSNDSTKSIINKYSNEIDIFISEKDEGIYDAINKGISYATGEIICLLHSDDIFYDENILSKVANYFNNEKSADILLGGTIYKKKFNNKINRYYPAFGFKPWMLRFGYSPPHVSSFIKSIVYKQIGIYNPKFEIAGDFDFFTRCFLVNKIKFKTVKDIFVIMTEGGKSGENLKSLYISSREILKSLKQNKKYSNVFFILLRFPVKFIQLLLKNEFKN